MYTIINNTIINSNQILFNIILKLLTSTIINYHLIIHKSNISRLIHHSHRHSLLININNQNTKILIPRTYKTHYKPYNNISSY